MCQKYSKDLLLPPVEYICIICLKKETHNYYDVPVCQDHYKPHHMIKVEYYEEDSWTAAREYEKEMDKIMLKEKYDTTT